eukprot:172144-Hanusia_phi.AAC.1
MEKRGRKRQGQATAERNELSVRLVNQLLADPKLHIPALSKVVVPCALVAPQPACCRRDTATRSCMVLTPVRRGKGGLYLASDDRSSCRQQSGESCGQRSM